ncbi:glycoside hydrolase family 3 protein [Sistotremastrum niveocremeum HHB9708]|uniref:beta-glucosidase n=1 Tax=Sistotremastrum niveocremeum HHB9708 TaxID=1314777 RepID=A0A164XED4_9AGAM|nr:glycoside hydrolase family 3 protein [Sistotremastrum niveocremeum HHB9708]
MRLFLVASVVAFLPLVSSQAGNYQQCGGIGWSGATTCSSGWVCTVLNPYYSQCLQSSSTSSSTSTSKSTSSTTTSSTTKSTTTSSSTTSSTSKSTSTSTSTSTSSSTTSTTTSTTAVAKLSLQDKVNLATGVQWQKGNCVGNTPPISSINFPGLCLEDSPLGVRYADYVSAFPPAINVAATFNRTLMNARGVAMGQEFRGKGVHVALGPMMNLARAPAAGRNWEGFGADPYLSGEGAYQTVQGVQSVGVQACAKHYINNEQEHYRDSSSSNVDDRTQHELYLAPFLKAVQAGVASVMCSYSEFNGSFSCENSATLNGLLKGELGFKGYVMSDWWATHSTGGATAGLDMTMPGDTAANSGTSYFGQALVNAVNSGQVATSRVTDMATRILAAWYLLGQDSGYPAVNFDAWNLNAAVNTHVNVQSNHGTLIRQIDAASMILLKNTNNLLPLHKPKSLGVIGSAAGANPSGPNACSDRSCDTGVLGMGWGSGTDSYPYLTTPLSALQTQAQTDGTTLTSSTSDTDLNGAANAANGKSAAIVIITADSGEGYLTVEGAAGDRNDLSAWHSGDALVQQVAKYNNNTIVVVNSVGAINMEAWVTNPNVSAIVWMGVPGQEAGNGLLDVLYGNVNPSGRLPFTIGKSINDYSAAVLYSGSGIVPIPYTEGLFIDYFHFDQILQLMPYCARYEFGFGLSYTTFQYSGISVTGSTAGGSPPTGPGSSLDPWLHNPVVTVTFTVENSGSIAGTEIPQLYLGLPTSSQSPPKRLKGFDSIFLQAGASQTVSMSLSRYDFSTWSPTQQSWTIATGVTTIYVGASSRDIRLTTTITN